MPNQEKRRHRHRGPLAEPIYSFAWGNNDKRATMKGRQCRVVASGALASCLIEFLDDRQRDVVSRRALRHAAQCASDLCATAPLLPAERVAPASVPRLQPGPAG